MKKRIFQFYAILFATLSFLLSNLAYADNNLKRHSFDTWMNNQLFRYHIHGASIAIIKNYKIIYQKGYGYANAQKRISVKPDTLFQIASVTKPFTALAAILTVQKGKLQLDTNVNQYLTSWKIPNNKYTRYHKVTLEELLSHTAGIIAEGYPGYCSKCKLPTLLQVLNGVHPAVNKPIRVVETPGKSYLYSTPGYIIIQQLLIDTYKQPFPNIIKKLVLAPLKMTSSTLKYPLPKDLAARASIPYDKNGQPVIGGAHVVVGSAADGMWSTAPDLTKFIIAIQKALDDKTSPLSHETVKLMLRPVAQIKKNVYASLAFDILTNKKYNQTNSTYFMKTGQSFGFEAFIIGSEQNGNGAVVLINSCFDRSTKILEPPFKADQCSPDLKGNAISLRSLVIRRIAKMEDW